MLSGLGPTRQKKRHLGSAPRGHVGRFDDTGDGSPIFSFLSLTFATSRAALAAGEGVEGAAVALEARGTPYQLHAMRPLRELIRALPAPLQRFEMEHGMALRTRWMFTPLCDELVARIAILDRLAG